MRTDKEKKIGVLKLTVKEVILNLVVLNKINIFKTFQVVIHINHFNVIKFIMKL